MWHSYLIEAVSWWFGIGIVSPDGHCLEVPSNTASGNDEQRVAVGIAY